LVADTLERRSAVRGVRCLADGAALDCKFNSTDGIPSSSQKTRPATILPEGEWRWNNSLGPRCSCPIARRRTRRHH
jgi:hypothetical protein